MGFLQGTIFITDDVNVIYNTPLGGMNKVVNLDEDDILPENNNILNGTCLLPPMEAKIAEADGNEQMYDTIYQNHLLAPYQQQFISALIAFLYRGGNLLLFLPEIGCTNTLEKLIEHLYRIYGIHVGFVNAKDPMNANCFYDEKCIPIWLNMIYTAGVISAYEFLFMDPEDARITNEVMYLLIDEIKPYEETINDKINYIYHLRKLIHKNPKTVPAIQSLEV